jgi:hypothetical protein
MLSGFNTNFRRRGVLFHVQTEDSGLAHPHVITHLFHGGSIMASEKRDYSELLTRKAGDELETAVRKLMQGLHKSMLKALSRGDHDAVIEQRVGAGVFAPAAETVAHAEADEREDPRWGEGPAASPAPRRAASPTAGAVQGRSVPRPAPAFGERFLSGRRLDEVVLAHLALRAPKGPRG